MMNSQKERMIDTWGIRAQLYYFFNGIKRIAKDRKLLSVSAIYLIACLIIRHILNINPSPISFGRMWLFTLVTFGVLAGFVLYKGKPTEAGKMMRSFIRIGFISHVCETPLLMDKYIENGIIHLTFRNCSSIPLSKWLDCKENLESALNLNITDISEQGKRYILVTAVSGDIVLPDYIRWDDSFLPQQNFVLALGESYVGQVTVNLAVTPHLLIGGSTGSGKTILLKNLMFQCMKKGSSIYIADFKGGVDFPKVWHNKCTFITEIGDLISILNEIVTELHRRKELLAEHDCANIDEYNKKYHQHLQRIIFACDEVAEMLDKTGLIKEQKQKVAEIEAYISTIARLGRAFGIHLFLATQRPDANVISGQIKNNIDCRICGRADGVLSQIILDKTDANDIIPKTSQGRFLMNDGTVFQAYWFDDEKI